ncbi:MAG: class II fructose-bisphosphate aldolase [Candidatus Taylorbacteria bacterium]|nr:class II fructose-bisphosphate aldolase [Candidatus Taylorbacteria bacterium]
MKSLRTYIRDAEKSKVALGHFNISNIEMLWGIFHAAKDLDLPIIIGVSEGERSFIGVKQCVALVKSIRGQYNYPIFINADHTYSIDKVKEAVDAGFDMVIFDGAKLSFEENVKNTRACVEYVRSVNPEIIVEGELGYIGQSSKVLDEIPVGVDLEKGLTTAEQAKQFVKETGVDLFAPAVGNIHGMLRNSKDPHLDIERIREIRKASGVPLVLHGGSGTPDEDFVKAIDVGVSVIHISTELRVAYRDALKLSFQGNLEEVAPYKYLKEAVSAVGKVVSDRLKLFNKII